MKKDQCEGYDQRRKSGSRKQMFEAEGNPNVGRSLGKHPMLECNPRLLFKPVMVTKKFL